MSKIDEAKKNLGELFVMGFDGQELSDETSAFLSQANIGGIIFFARNYVNPQQIAELSDSIQACRSKLPLWISVDHEGGTVQRFMNGFTPIPEARDLTEKKSPKDVFEISEMIAKELFSVGVNLNYSPVTDINSNPLNPIIGRRAFGEKEEETSKYVSSFVRGHVTNGVHACAKHFPGHGDTTVDSHLALPTVTTPLELLRDREFKPFIKAFKAGCRFLMTAHVLNPSLDPQFPATLSSYTLNTILREELRFSGLIMSDDLEMQAITDHYGADMAPVMAINAGCDLLIYRSEAGARHAYASMLKALDDGRLSADRVNESAELSRQLKEETLLPYSPTNADQIKAKVGTPANRALVQH
jgi:beta-N-acetylhexosaminidase